MAVVLAALYAALGWVLREVVLKFVVWTVLFLLVKEITAVMVPMLPTVTGLNGAFAAIPSGVWYFLDAFGASFGIPAVISALSTRFIIRRLPVVG